MRRCAPGTAPPGADAEAIARWELVLALQSWSWAAQAGDMRGQDDLARWIRTRLEG